MKKIADRSAAPGGFVGSVREPSDIRGFMVHIAEGNDVSGYLSRNPLRNVSVQYCVEADGAIVAMVPELRTAGSLNPAALRDDDDKGGYYGRSHLNHALKDGVTNPNFHVIAVEVAGRHKAGPNAAQVDALVRLFKDCRKRYPKIVPLAHRDQQDVKPCPGKTETMRQAFRLMGGHGRDYDPAPKPKPAPEPEKPTPVEDLAEQVEILEASNRAKDRAIRKIIEDLQGVLEHETEEVGAPA
jgi:N-acetyl-anhydromuramyl-L-alanine amidase AmpD